MKRTIKIENNISNYLEQLAYESSAYKNLVKFLIQEGIPYEDERFQRIYKDSVMSLMSYDLAKNRFRKKINIPNHTSWELDFETQILTIEEE